jgi:hypothetical protein
MAPSHKILHSSEFSLRPAVRCEKPRAELTDLTATSLRCNRRGMACNSSTVHYSETLREYAAHPQRGRRWSATVRHLFAIATHSLFAPANKRS